VLLDVRQQVVRNSADMKLLVRLDKLKEKFVTICQQHLDDYDRFFEVRKMIGVARRRPMTLRLRESSAISKSMAGQ
jgi:hypothetical protein